MFYPYLCICCYASFVREHIVSTLPSLFGQANDISVVSFSNTRRYRPRNSSRVDCCRALAQSLTVCNKLRNSETRTSTHCLAVHIHSFVRAWGWWAVSYGSRETYTPERQKSPVYATTLWCTVKSIPLMVSLPSLPPHLVCTFSSKARTTVLVTP